VHERLDAERPDDGYDTQWRDDVVDEVTGEHREPVDGWLDAADSLTVLGTGRALFDRQRDERTE